MTPDLGHFVVRAKVALFISKFIEMILPARLRYDISRIMKVFIDVPDITVAAAQFAALGSEQRLGVLRVLVRAGPEGLSIGELGARAGVTGSTLTHHMKILASAGLVAQTRQGRTIICAAVAFDEVETLSRFLLKECCADRAAPTEDETRG